MPHEVLPYGKIKFAERIIMLKHKNKRQRLQIFYLLPEDKLAGSSMPSSNILKKIHSLLLQDEGGILTQQESNSSVVLQKEHLESKCFKIILLTKVT